MHRLNHSVVQRLTRKMLEAMSEQRCAIVEKHAVQMHQTIKEVEAEADVAVQSVADCLQACTVLTALAGEASSQQILQNAMQKWPSGNADEALAIEHHLASVAASTSTNLAIDSQPSNLDRGHATARSNTDPGQHDEQPLDRMGDIDDLAAQHRSALAAACSALDAEHQQALDHLNSQHSATVEAAEERERATRDEASAHQATVTRLELELAESSSTLARADSALQQSEATASALASAAKELDKTARQRIQHAASVAAANTTLKKGSDTLHDQPEVQKLTEEHFEAVSALQKERNTVLILDTALVQMESMHAAAVAEWRSRVERSEARVRSLVDQFEEGGSANDLSQIETPKLASTKAKLIAALDAKEVAEKNAISDRLQHAELAGRLVATESVLDRYLSATISATRLPTRE